MSVCVRVCACVCVCMHMCVCHRSRCRKVIKVRAKEGATISSTQIPCITAVCVMQCKVQCKLQCKLQ